MSKTFFYLILSNLVVVVGTIITSTVGFHIAEKEIARLNTAINAKPGEVKIIIHDTVIVPTDSSLIKLLRGKIIILRDSILDLKDTISDLMGIVDNLKKEKEKLATTLRNTQVAYKKCSDDSEKIANQLDECKGSLENCNKQVNGLTRRLGNCQGVYDVFYDELVNISKGHKRTYPIESKKRQKF